MVHAKRQIQLCCPLTQVLSCTVNHSNTRSVLWEDSHQQKNFPAWFLSSSSIQHRATPSSIQNLPKSAYNSPSTSNFFEDHPLLLFSLPFMKPIIHNSHQHQKRNSIHPLPATKSPSPIYSYQCEHPLLFSCAFYSAVTQNYWLQREIYCWYCAHRITHYTFMSTFQTVETIIKYVKLIDQFTRSLHHLCDPSIILQSILQRSRGSVEIDRGTLVYRSMSHGIPWTSSSFIACSRVVRRIHNSY